jgi:hypothetical protein
LATSRRLLAVLATAVLIAAAGCSASPSPPAGAPAPATPSGPNPVYTLEKPEHRTPVPLVWHEESRSFFVGTFHDGTIYRGTLDDPTVRVFLEGQPGRSASGLAVVGDRILVAGGGYGDIRIHDVSTGARLGDFTTGPGGFLNGMTVADGGDVWVTDAGRPVLWRLTADQVAAGSGTPTSVPLAPEIPQIRTPDNVEGVVALTATRLVVVKYADGTLYRIDLDPQAPQGRRITLITGATVPLGSRMTLDGRRLLVADENGVSVVELSDDAASGTVVARLRDPSFHDTTSVARVGDRYLVANAAWNDPPPYTISSVPAVP